MLRDRNRSVFAHDAVVLRDDVQGSSVHLLEAGDPKHHVKDDHPWEDTFRSPSGGRAGSASSVVLDRYVAAPG